MSTSQEPGSTTTVVQQAVTENTDKRDVAGFLKRQLQQSLAFGTLVVLVIFFSIASPSFFTFSNIASVLLSTAVIGILALGTTFVIITGGIDLSIGTGMALCAVMTGVFITNMGLPIAVGVIGGIATGVLMGLVNGLNITYLRLPPFIATLAMMMIAGGLALVISGVAPIYFSTSAPDFKRIALGVIIPGIPNAVLITAVLAVIAYIVLTKTLLGRYTFAIGSNEEATRLSGVNTRRWTILIYMFAGAFTGIAGVVIASRLDSAQPQIGMGYELQAIAAVIIGGTSLLGGRGSILGTVIGALIMSVLVNGLRIMSIQTEWQNIVVGIVVLLAVFFDSLRNRQRT
ncbi:MULTISPECIES: ABC transporter permease [Microbacterium]|uniref:ABC transporter permease n=1 Tax=Microbacterium TaxID=33882 RepID=UPI00217E85B7|nr:MULTISPECIES: ABC transporter permease [Microbacterium]UWF77336.1 ABC transporter permease [Microbacterium neungamense]WCM55495.1 ABC transporter permease [Microbacterium sp. EF45047]